MVFFLEKLVFTESYGHALSWSERDSNVYVVMITRLMWITWTSISAVRERPLNLIIHSLLWMTSMIINFSCKIAEIYFVKLCAYVVHSFLLRKHICIFRQFSTPSWHAKWDPLYPTYHQVYNIRCTLVGNEIVDHSDVVGASPVGAAPTTSSFST